SECSRLRRSRRPGKPTPPALQSSCFSYANSLIFSLRIKVALLATARGPDWIAGERAVLVADGELLVVDDDAVRRQIALSMKRAVVARELYGLTDREAVLHFGGEPRSQIHVGQALRPGHHYVEALRSANGTLREDFLDRSDHCDL